MTCDSFKSNGFEEGGDEVEVAKDGEELFVLVEVVDFDSSAGDEIELFSCDFMLDEDDEDFNSVDGFAGTKMI